ncbi:diguanylate cyclase [Candidatus Magnetoovum chiemensis]|nr:diguanylate cyclase [Candidatus Magnetoovum chiemensis]
MKEIKSIKTKLIIRIVTVFILLSIIIQSIVFYSFRNLSLEASEEKALTIAELIRDTITSFMILGAVDRQNIFIDRIKYTHGLKRVRIISGDSVRKQFKKDTDSSTDNSTDKIQTPLEYEVFMTGEMKSTLRETLRNVEYELVIPYKATSQGPVKCTLCHNAKEGEVLGAVSIVIDLSHQRKETVSTLSIMVLVSLIFSICTLYIIYKFFKPYTDLFQKLKQGFVKAQIGEFDERINVKLSDEAGDVARGYNAMINNLSSTLTKVSDKVSLLMGHRISTTGNSIIDTINTVEMLVRIYNFKRIIEKDTRKTDIYLRIKQMLENLKIKTYSFYEVNQDKGNMFKVLSNTADDTSELDNSTEHKENNPMFCSELILSNPDECRAKRTASIVDSNEFNKICPNFFFANRESFDTGQINHYCIPIYIGGQVGLVVEIVYQDNEKEEILDNLPYINSYLKETEPVLEAKTFMELLKGQSLVDQLTGLYNRRYLDEINRSLCAQTVRRKTILGIMMIDIDYFKQVNDNYGHDVGDLVLKRTAAIIKSAVRESDIVIRYGGEEILALLVDCNENIAIEIAEKVRQRIEKEEIQVPCGVLKKTVSIGVSEYPKQDDKFWQCVKLADTALYKAKEDGRNRAYIFNSAANEIINPSNK